MIQNNENSVALENTSDNSITENVVEGKNENPITFSVGQDIEVTPTGFKEYGVFCDCGHGYTGLVHISRITTKFVKNVSDYFTIGKPFTAKIIEVHEGAKKLSLSTKEFNLDSKA